MRAAIESAGFDIPRRIPVVSHHGVRPLVALALEGLSEEQKELPAVLLHDASGAALYERVCAQPEYYLARAETRLLERHGAAIGELTGPQAALIEYGLSSARKTRILLSALPDPHAYVAVDVDSERLEQTCGAIQRRFRGLRVVPRCQDFRHFVTLPATIARARQRLAFFSGPTIGNFRQLEVGALLNSMRETIGPGGTLLVGVDLLKDPATLERAYDDAAGAMAQFNLNVLARLNRELGATFALDAFRHYARWDSQNERIEMGLVSLRAQTPCVAGITIALAADETIRTQFAHKYTPETFAAMVRVAGWRVREVWADSQDSYSLQFLEAAD
jgi:L-histidine N-alpha-methyltransferase